MPEAPFLTGLRASAGLPIALPGTYKVEAKDNPFTIEVDALPP
jgi:hypothetical protein